MPKISAKFDRGQPQMLVGLDKIGDFRQITGYISKTVQDRRTVSVSRIESPMRDDDLDDLTLQATSISTFCNAFHIFVMGVIKNVKFGL